MIKIDMWYNDSPQDADNINILFYDNDGEYRGNIYKNGKTIGDYTATSSEEIEKTFTQFVFNWD